MSTTAVLDASIQRARKLDPDLILGHLCWYTIHEQTSGGRTMNVSHKNIVDGLKAAGLTGTAPAAPKGHDLFRRVTSDAQSRKVPTQTPGVFQNVLLRDVSGAGETAIVRRLVVETVDSKGQKLSYHQLADVAYQRASGKITHKYRDDYSQNVQLADRTILLVRQNFRDQQDMITSWSIREFVKKMLYSRGATCVRAGGAVFFLRQEFAEDLEAIETFVDGIPGGIGDFHSLPLPDDLKQRKMLQKAFEEESTGAIYERLAELDEIKKAGKKLTSGKKAALLVEMQDLKKKAKQYSELLETSLDQTSSAITILEGRLKKILDQEEADG